MITASHNTKEWNGFKLCRKDDVPISGATGIADIQKLVEQNDFKAAEKPGTLSTYNIAEEYGKFLRSFKYMGETALVLHLPFVCISLYANGYSYPKKNFNVGLNIGYLIFNPKMLD